MKTFIVINGACGRMGQRLVQLAREDRTLAISAALEMPGHPHLGRDVGDICGLGPIGVPVQDELQRNQRVDAVIDFSTPDGTMQVLPVCVQRRLPLVVATTGHTREQRKEIEGAAHDIPLLMTPNLSLAVTLLMKLVGEAAIALRDKGFDVEILERHHRFKKDSPSGTALHFVKIVQDAMGQTELRHGREGNVGERTQQEIGVHSIRVGDNVGEHTIIFSTLGETLELTHRAHARDCYVRGALQAAKYIANRSVGRYTMNDVLGL